MNPNYPPQDMHPQLQSAGGPGYPPPPQHPPHMMAQSLPSMAPYQGQPPPDQQAPPPGNGLPVPENLDHLKPMEKSEGGRRYSLVVVQQPQRARMCGFGDKDRRPITPPPCVRLVITDVSTGKEVDCNEIDHSMYVLNVDLWSEDGLREVNLVRHSTSTPSISSTTPASYTSLSDTTPAFAPVPSSRDPSYPSPASMGYGQPIMPAAAYTMPPTYSQPQYMPQNGYGPPTQYFPHAEFRPDIPPGMPVPSQAMSPYGNPQRSVYGDVTSLTRMAMGTGQPQGMFTRNLIGSLAASAFRLTDPDDKIGIWFILQDLSVRTEGNFRLRFSFVNVGPTLGSTGAGTVSASSVNTGKAPVLAATFSDVFNVYSAKKFPGVCDSTKLSKCFATQGIKIPIRKEGGNSKDDGGSPDYSGL